MPRSSGSPARRVPLAGILLGALCALPACGEQEPAGGGEGTEGAAAGAAPGAGDGGAALEDAIRRERAVAFWADGLFSDATQELQPLLARQPPALDDLLLATSIAFEQHEQQDFAAADALLQRARQIAGADDDPRVQWALYRVARHEFEFEAALEHVRRAAEARPDSFATRLALAMQLGELDRDAEAEPILVELLARDQAGVGGFYVTAVHQYVRLLRIARRTAEADRWQEVFSQLSGRGIEAPVTAVADRGDLGVVLPPRPRAAGLATLSPLPAGASLVRGAVQPVAGVDGLCVVSFTPSLALPADAPYELPAHRTGADASASKVLTQCFRRPAGEQALLLFGPGGLRLAHPQGPTDGLRLEELLPGPVSCAAACDLDADGRLDLIAATSDGLRWLRGTPQGFALETQPLATWSQAPTDLSLVDFDHEGDVDLLLVGPGGPLLLRNDGVGKPGGGFRDVSAAAGLPLGAPGSWCLVEDLDTDQDVDLLLGLERGPLLMNNERGERFADASARLPQGFSGARKPWVGDLDADSRPDLAAFDGERLSVWLAQVPHGWEPVAAQEAPGASGAAGAAGGAVVRGAPVGCDPFLEGRARLLWPVGALGLGSTLPLPGAEDVGPAAADATAATRPALALVDLDGDGVPELVRTTPEGLVSYRVKGAGSHRLRLSLEGETDNTGAANGGLDPSRGLGAIVELRAGPLYQRHYARGHTLLLGFGPQQTLDVLRITWPNGVMQHLLDWPLDGPDRDLLVQQKSGQGGSCPFLYAWNGSTYGFVTDVLGGTPLGLPMARGQLVPPDHDEYVLLRGDQLQPRDGRLEIQLTEELREVTYLDHVRLQVVDHPQGSELQPNERFCFPPFPEARRHVFTGALAPRRAVDGEGRDWTAALAVRDEQLAVPYRGYGGRFLGLAPRHTLELQFDAAAVAAASHPWLALTGWFLWTDASVNVAAEGDPLVAFEPPLLEVPDGAGGWRAVGPPIGFPSGKAKTMLVDLDGLLVRDDPRLRLSTTLCLAWDTIRLVPDGTDGESRVLELAPQSATLWQRGFSRLVGDASDPALERFEWDALEPLARWNQHPGLYTRLGDVLPLLTTVDDCFVILGAGDALHVVFEAPPPPSSGWTRDYLLHLDGWAKDRDPNAVDVLSVEPLPFHGMSGYPYPADERFPDDEVHRAYRAEWNTRPATRWIAPLAQERTR